VPLGTQRTDIYLLPVLIVLVVSALQRLLVMLKRRGVARVVTTSSLVTGVVLLVAIELVVAPHRIAVEPGSSRETMLPNLKPAAALVNEALRTPSTAVLVANPPWEWVYAADTAFQVAPSEASQTGFTVLSREANVGLASVNNAGFTTVHLRALSLRMRKSARVILLARPKSSADVAIHRELSAAGWTLVATTAQQTEILERWIPHSAVGEATGPTR
jgi:hypothetical protein